MWGTGHPRGTGQKEGSQCKVYWGKGVEAPKQGCTQPGHHRTQVGKEGWNVPPLPPSPVMLSTSTCHLCSSCSSCRISRFWRRSATVSSGARVGGKKGRSKVTSTLY